MIHPRPGTIGTMGMLATPAVKTFRMKTMPTRHFNIHLTVLAQVAFAILMLQ